MYRRRYSEKELAPVRLNYTEKEWQWAVGTGRCIQQASIVAGARAYAFGQQHELSPVDGNIHRVLVAQVAARWLHRALTLRVATGAESIWDGAYWARVIDDTWAISVKAHPEKYAQKGLWASMTTQTKGQQRIGTIIATVDRDRKQVILWGYYKPGTPSTHTVPSRTEPGVSYPYIAYDALYPIKQLRRKRRNSYGN